MSRLIIKHIPPNKTSDDLAAHLQKITGLEYGYDLTSAKVQVLSNGRSREFAFVGCRGADVAEGVKAKLNGTYWENRKISVQDAMRPEDIDLNKASSRHSRKKAEKAKDPTNKGPKWGTEAKDKKKAHIVEAITKYSNSSKRIFVENLPYKTTVEELKDYFGTFGAVEDVNMLRCELTGETIGKCFIEYDDNSAVQDVLKKDRDFQGRILWIQPAAPLKVLEEADRSGKKGGSSYKKKQIEKNEANAENSESWNLLYVNSSIATQKLASSLGISRADLLSLESFTHSNMHKGSTAAKAALAETFLVKDIKEWLESMGVKAEMFDRKGKVNALSEAEGIDRSDDVLVVKHLPDGVTESIITDAFKPYGPLDMVSICPTGTIALVKFLSAKNAKKALKKLQLKPLIVGDKVAAPLYLEYAPICNPKIAQTCTEDDELLQEEVIVPKKDSKDSNVNNLTSSKLMIRNIAFQAVIKDIKPLFEAFGTVLTCRLPKNRDGRIRGFAFVEMSSISEADACLSNLSATHLYGRRLVIEPAAKDINEVIKRRKEE